MAMLTRRYGAEEGGVPTLWTPGLMIAGLAVVAIIFLKADELRSRRRARAGLRRPKYRRG